MAVTLANEILSVEITPERGVDVRAIRDVATGVQVLSVSPTGAANVPRLASPSTAIPALNGYPGGWQLHAPNAGPEREYQGVTLGFHGEAALAEWRVLTQTPTSLTAETYLVTAPLHLVREFVLDGASLRVTTTVTNLSPDAYATRLLEHPAFGDEFIDEHSYLELDAATVITDAAASGSLVAPGLVGAPSDVLGAVGGRYPLPAPGSRQSIFGAFANFATPRVSFYSPTHGFGMRIDWDASVFPFAWFWIEANHGSGWPWFRRLYATAVEPANIVPDGPGAAGSFVRGGDGRELAGGESITFTTTISRVELPDAI